MKILSWNCNMAFRKKWQHVLHYDPDILVIQECEKESKYKSHQIIPTYNEFIWIGDNENKGVGIISFNDYHISLYHDYRSKYKYIIPIKVSGKSKFNLFAVWAMPDKETPKNSYVVQIWKALHQYQNMLDDQSILVGDFNSNQIWDKIKKSGNHTDVVNFLAKKNIHSLYHYFNNEEHGSETKPTFYLVKKQHKPYHLDYCFASKSMFNKMMSIHIGTYEDWISISDHMPIVVDLSAL